MTLDIRARHMMGTHEELDHAGEIIERETAKSLGTLEKEEGTDWARASRRDAITLLDLYRELKGILDPLQTVTVANGDYLYGIDYFSRMYQYDEHTHRRTLEERGIPVLTDTTKLDEVRYHWIAVFPVTGGSEGHYVHVDLLWQRDHREGRIPLFLLKTFGGHAEAVSLAGLLARVLGT